MIKYIIVDGENYVIASGTCGDDETVDAPNGCTVVYGVMCGIGELKVKYVGGALIDTGERWSDPVTLVDAVERKCLEVDAERERLTMLPIEYAGAAFDADARAQRNIQAWQLQIAAGVVLPIDFVWRDANNIDHACDANYLNGLGAAITLRGTLLYQCAWTHKAAIATLATLAAVRDYDINTGWTS